MTGTFDTHDAVRKLEASGMPTPQAEVLTSLIRDTRWIDLSNFVTKDDLRAALRDLEQRMTIKIGGMIGVGVAFLALLKFFG